MFVIVMEVLNALIIEADRQGQLTPLPGNAIRHRASIYADDLVLFLAPTALDCACIRQLLDLFAGASGLVTNMAKCTITRDLLLGGGDPGGAAMLPGKAAGFPD